VERVAGDRERKIKQDAAVREQLERRFGVGVHAILRNVHERDAFGCLLGALEAPPEVRKPPKERGPRAPRKGVVTRSGHDAGTLTRAHAIADEVAKYAHGIRVTTLARKLSMRIDTVATALRIMIKLGRVERLERGRYGPAPATAAAPVAPPEHP
jgi:hypothetical protein